MWVVMRFVPWEAFELAPVGVALPVTVVSVGGELGMGFIPVYETRAEAEAHSENGLYQVCQIRVPVPQP